MENLRKTDPEFMERFEHFAFEEVPNEAGQQLDEETRCMAVLATLLGCQGTDAYQVMLPKALDAGLSPVQVKEIVSTRLSTTWAWAGYGRFWRSPTGFLSSGAWRCPCPLRLRPPWETAWKRVRRLKWKSLGNI